jgi:hypothetical protein
MPSREAEILARAIQPEAGGLTKDAARCIMAIKLPDADRDRVNELAAKARAGARTDQERSELDDYERIASLLQLLQSKARLSLKQAGLASE